MAEIRRINQFFFGKYPMDLLSRVSYMSGGFLARRISEPFNLTFNRPLVVEAPTLPGREVTLPGGIRGKALAVKSRWGEKHSKVWGLVVYTTWGLYIYIYLCIYIYSWSVTSHHAELISPTDCMTMKGSWMDFNNNFFRSSAFPGDNNMILVP